MMAVEQHMILLRGCGLFRAKWIKQILSLAKYSQYRCQQQNASVASKPLSLLLLLVKERLAPSKFWNPQLIYTGGERIAHPELQLARGQAKKAGGTKVVEKCLILSSPCLGCLWLIFQHFSAIQLCPQSWGSVKNRKQKTMHIQHHAERRTMCGECFSSFILKKQKVSDRQVDMKVNKYWWLFDHFISHPQTAFCRQRACWCFSNIDFLPTLYSSLVSPNLILNLKRHRPRNVVCILKSSWLLWGRNTDL